MMQLIPLYNCDRIVQNITVASAAAATAIAVFIYYYFFDFGSASVCMQRRASAKVYAASQFAQCTLCLSAFGFVS